jgi:hypothetical protein
VYPDWQEEITGAPPPPKKKIKCITSKTIVLQNTKKVNTINRFTLREIQQSGLVYNIIVINETLPLLQPEALAARRMI